VLLRHLKYLTALARERHFARAAAASDVSQPALSAAIRQLEEELGVPIVERGNRFIGLTSEGELVLAWARRTLSDHETLLQRLSGAGPLRGRLRIGVVPSVVPVMPELSSAFTAAQPGVALSERSMSSIDIGRELHDYELDVAVTYLDGEPLAGVRTLPLYRERYVLITPRHGPFEGAASVRWRDVGRLRLCLQNQSMQNRRILDGVFAEANVEAAIGLETNSIAALCGYVREGPWSSIVPDVFLPWFDAQNIAVFTLVEPEVSKSIGLVTLERPSLPPVVEAFWAASEAWIRGRPS
jgi:DNA-binding transcriptional LysR family regulator